MFINNCFIIFSALMNTIHKQSTRESRDPLWLLEEAREGLEDQSGVSSEHIS